MNNIAIIPARSGSKGLKDKNIKLLNGKPLLAYSIEAAIESNMFDEIMVSTDSYIYADIAKRYGANVPFLRSAEQSCDSAGSWSVVNEVLKEYKKIGYTFNTVCLLQPTSPLRKSGDIIGAYNFFSAKNADAVTSVCEMEHSPQWAMILPEDGSLAEFRKNVQNVPRQQLPKYYRINGAIYIRKIEYVDDNILIKDCNEFAFVMDRKKSVDIDTVEDFEVAQFFLNIL
ncbi:MAG: acylneuraminate cytidylyltransferase family protein [Coprococcus sp.]|nr:acylneuraminate cytidylyltransferase family protein [Coprococcus sp.]